MRKSVYIRFAIALLLLPVLASCRKELCYDHFPTFHVSFTWEHEWERDYGEHHLADWDADYHGCDYHSIRPGVPEWITMVRYFDEGTPEERYLKPEGGAHRMGNDASSLLLYNGDTEYIILHDVASLYEARATATSRSRSSISYVAEKHPNARSTNSPDVLYSAYVTDIPYAPGHELTPLAINMQPLVYTYIVSYEFDEGIEYVSLARGALGGMAESVYLRNGTTSEEASIILFDCDIKPYGCRAEVRSFGAPGFPDIYYGRTESEPKERKYTLNLEVMLTNGKTEEFNFDVSDQLAKQPRGGVIKISGIKVEKPQNEGGGSSGFDATVDDWGNKVVEDLPVWPDE